MVLLHQEQFDELYDKVKTKACASDSEVMFFVAMDTDALCACKMLTELFKYDHIRFAIHPVDSYASLQNNFREILEAQPESRCVFLINCGANLNLEEFLGLSDYAGLVLTVVDSHRPLDLNNIQEQDEDAPFELYILDSGDPEDEASRPDLSVLEEMSENSDDSSGSSSDSDDLDSDSEDEEERRRKRRTVGEDGEPQDVDDEDEDDEISRRRRRRKQKRKQKELEQHIEDYYSVTYYGATASSFVFALASQLNQKANKLLWLNIVALTDYYVFERYTGDQYQEKVEFLQNEVGRLNMQPDEDALAGGPEQDRIAFSEEFRFMLPRFWTLYDSMSHSSYVACRLGLWKEPGRLKLDTLLAKMGIPLSVCKQRYSHMSLEYKRQLRDRIPQFAEDFGLTEITYGSFEKFDGFRSKLSAADVVYGVNALLEANGTEGEDQLSVTKRNFWTAFQGLSNNGERESQDILQRGFDLAIRNQQMIVMQGKIVIDKNSVSDCGKSFQWITMHETVDADAFSQPLSLAKLALFLSGALRKSKRRTKVKPLVLASFVAARDMYLVVGVIGAPRVGDTSLLHNKFGNLFRKAADATAAQVKHDGFDLSVIEIKKEDLRKVYDYLSVHS